MVKKKLRFQSIEFMKNHKKDEEIYEILEEEIGLWFKKKYGKFTPPQKYAVYEIHNKENVLISSPTGSGKTLSAFLSILNELLKLKKSGELKDEVYCVYVSPLRALNNDIKRNLEDPLKEIEELSGKKLGIRVGVRTSDTTSYQKARMLKKPPHILITTPESLGISLNSPKFSELYRSVKYVIVDEIHALAGNKRGAHLSLTLERMQNKTNEEAVRIGLSATVHPLEEVAKFLVGDRDCKIVDVNYLKETEIRVMSPVDDFIYAPIEKINKSMYELLDDLIQSHKTTLIFTNTRSATERVVFHLKEKFGERYKDLISAHHSSLSRKERLEVEEKLKNGELKVVVSSTSLELGIDIGNIDLVILLGSPKSVSRALQRIGRSGHKLHEKSKGILVVLDRDDLVEDTLIAYNAIHKNFDKIRIPKRPLDVLAQHILGMSLEKKWRKKDAFELIRRSYVYRDLKKEEFERVLRYLAGGYEELEARNIYAKIWEEGEEFGKRGKLSRVLYYMNTGTIPDESYVKVVTRSGKYIGKVEEEFAERLITGDTFVLGGKVYEFVYSRASSIYVDPAEGKRPTIPSWFSEMLPLSYEVSLSIEEFRKEVERLILKDEKEALFFLLKNYPIEENSAEAIISYIKEQMTYSVVPGGDVFLVEHYIDEDRHNNYIFHTLAGRKANEAIARAFGYLISKSKRTNVRITFNDYGVMITLDRFKKLGESNIKELISLDEEEFENYIKEALEGSELFRRKFRQVAVRGLAILRRYPKRTREMSIARQQMSSDALLKLIKMYYPDFPIIEEAYKEIMNHSLNMDEAKDYLKKIKERKLIFLRELEIPTPFSFSLVATGAKDVVVMEDRKRFVEELHKKLMEKISGKKE